MRAWRAWRAWKRESDIALYGTWYGSYNYMYLYGDISYGAEEGLPLTHCPLHITYISTYIYTQHIPSPPAHMLTSSRPLFRHSGNTLVTPKQWASEHRTQKRTNHIISPIPRTLTHRTKAPHHAKAPENHSCHSLLARTTDHTISNTTTAGTKALIEFISFHYMIPHYTLL